MRRALAGLLVLAAFGAEAQLTPGAYCSVGSLTSASDPLYAVTEAEAAPLLKRALEACSIAVAEQPRNGYFHESLAQALALSGDYDAAVREARAAIERNWPDAVALLSALQLQGLGMARDPAAAIELLRPVSRSGTAIASYNMGLAYAFGIGVAQDDVDAFKHFRAAAQRDTLAMFEVAERFSQGRGVTRDPQEAERWWRKGAESLAIEGRRHPARWPRPLPFDANASLAWLRAKAAAGDAVAQTFLGMLYERGVWVGQDFAAALAWYRRAADQQHPAAEMQLAHMYSFGRGVAASRAQSQRWGLRSTERQCEAVAAGNTQVAACDRYAGDPYDPDQAGAGMASHCMTYMIVRARAACEKALAANPNAARTRAQLARTLAHDGKFADARREAKIAAAGGSTTAIVLLASMDENGYGGPKDPDAALKRYRQAAMLGDERALRHAQRIYEARGQRDTAEARELGKGVAMRGQRGRSESVADPDAQLLKRAESGDAKAQHNLAFQLEGMGNYTAALRWYLKAADQGYGLSALNAGQMYEMGLGAVPLDPAEALRLYRKPAEAGDDEARWRSALLYERGGKYADAVAWLRRLAKDGDTRGMVQLAEYYERGRGVERDMRQALALYERAAPKNVVAQFKAGVIHLEGDGVPRDPAAAHRAFRAAAERYHPAAMNNLGVLYEQGLGTPADDGAALDWYFKALTFGSNQALGNLDAFYERGRGAPQSMPEAMAWYRRGAEAGVPSAQFKLAQLYERLGPTQDLPQALLWYQRDAGSSRSLRAAARLYRLGVTLEPSRGGNIAGRLYAGQYAADMLLAQAARVDAVPRPPFPTGISTDPGEDRQRTLKLRVANTGSARSVAGDVGWSAIISGNPFTELKPTR